MLRKMWLVLQYVLLLVAVLGSYAFSNYRNELKKPEELQIIFVSKENLYIDEAMVNKLLIQNFEGSLNQAKERLVLNRLETILSEIPLIESAQVYLTIDGELRANIAQRQPIARVVGTSDVFYLDRLSKRMPLSNLHSARVPLITGNSSEEDLNNCFELLNFIEDEPFLRDDLVGIHIEGNQRYSLRLRAENLELYLGSVEKLPVKIAKLKAFYNKAKKDSIWSKYRKIDLSFENQIIGTKK
jgi:cell division protein FtsQ